MLEFSRWKTAILGSTMVVCRAAVPSVLHTVKRLGADRVLVETFDPTERWRWVIH